MNVSLRFPEKLGFHILKWTFTLGLSSILVACIGSTSQTKKADVTPEWVISPPKSNTYLYGVGSADKIDNIALALAQAEQSGNVQIAQQLKTQVSQVNTQDTQVTSVQNNEQVLKRQTAYTKVTTAPIELAQAVNEQRFVGEKYVYALQSINRSRVIANLTQAINDLDVVIRQKAASLNTRIDQTPANQDWQIYMRLIPDFAQRRSYLEERSLYAFSSAADTPQDIQNIEQQLGRALSDYGFDVSQTKQSDPLSSALSSYGLSPKSGSLFTLKSNTEQNIETQSGRYYAFETGSLALMSPEGSRIASWTVNARGIAKNQRSAEEKASENWSNQAVQAMFIWLTQQD